MPKKKNESSAPAPTVKEQESCEALEHPVFASSFHLPKNSWHEHRDWGGSVEEATEYEGFAAMTMTLLMELSGGSNRLVIGYLGDMLNVLPKNLRLAMLHVIVNGLGLDIQPAADELNTIDVNLIQRYEVLTPPDPSRVQLVTPSAASVPPELADKIRQQQKGQ